MRPRISITGSLRPSVGQSVGWLVGHAFVKNKVNYVLEQIILRGGILGSLDASLHLYETVYPSIGLSVHRYVCHGSVNVFQPVKERESRDESHVITSTHNHFIIIRTHRWPYGPCFLANNRRRRNMRRISHHKIISSS